MYDGIRLEYWELTIEEVLDYIIQPNPEACIKNKPNKR